MDSMVRYTHTVHCVYTHAPKGRHVHTHHTVEPCAVKTATVQMCVRNIHSESQSATAPLRHSVAPPLLIHTYMCMCLQYTAVCFQIILSTAKELWHHHTCTHTVPIIHCCIAQLPMCCTLHIPRTHTHAHDTLLR